MTVDSAIMTIDLLFKRKGELITTIEISQNKLQEVNKQIFEYLNNSNKEEKNEDNKGS